MSLVNSYIDVPLENIYYRVQYVLSDELRSYLRPIVPNESILIDMKRFSQIDGTDIDGYNPRDDYLLSTTLEIDDHIDGSSREMHRTWIRQQNPHTKRWSLYEINLFVSKVNSRVTIWVYQIYTDVELD